MVSLGHRSMASAVPDRSHHLRGMQTPNAVNLAQGTAELGHQSMHVQAVGRDAVTPDNHSGFWHQRYTLRGTAGASSGKQSGLPGAEPGVKHHPVFLEHLKDTILTTGVPVLLVTSCVCSM